MNSESVEINKATDATLNENELLDRIVNYIDRSVISGVGPFFSYIIGSNGTGKSRQLARLAEYYAKKTNKGVKSIGCISNAVYDRFTLTSNATVHYLGARTSGNAVFHSAIDRLLTRIILRSMQNDRKALMRLEKIVNYSLHFSIGSRAKIKDKNNISTFIDRRKVKNGSLNNIISKEEQGVLSEFIGTYWSFSDLSSDQIKTLLKLIDLNPDIKIYTQPSGVVGNYFQNMSTGEQNRLLTFAKVLSVASENSLILIDEPELSLHLHWQMSFHESISSMLRYLKRFHVVVATHSPTIISEGAKDNSLSDGNVVVLEKLRNTADSQLINARFHSFKEIESHDQLVLNDFNTAPYRTRAVDLEIANSILAAAKKEANPSATIQALSSLLEKKGLAPHDKRHIEAAIKIIGSGLTSQ